MSTEPEVPPGLRRNENRADKDHDLVKIAKVGSDPLTRPEVAAYFEGYQDASAEILGIIKSLADSTRHVPPARALEIIERRLDSHFQLAGHKALVKVRQKWPDFDPPTAKEIELGKDPLKRGGRLEQE